MSAEGSTQTIDQEDQAIANIEAAEIAQTASILDTLTEFLTDCPAAERAGMLAALEIIRANYATA